MDYPALRLGSSQRHIAVLSVTHAMALVAIWSSAVIGWVAVLLTVVVAWHFSWALKRPPYQAVGYYRGWYVLDAMGRKQLARLGKHTVIWRHLVVLDLQCFSGPRLYLPIYRDTLSVEDQRRLRVLLHCYGV